MYLESSRLFNSCWPWAGKRSTSFHQKEPSIGTEFAPSVEVVTVGRIGRVVDIQELTGLVLLSSDQKFERFWPNEFFRDRRINIAGLVPGDLRSKRLAATTLANLGHSSEAIAAFSEILRQHPGDFQSHCLLGDIYFRLGRIDDSLASFESATSCARLNAERAIAHFRMGEIYILKKITRQENASSAPRCHLTQNSNRPEWLSNRLPR
ncbi:MAG: tetratricopeptide repeat protein [Planctomycetes bacterium]|nr:tetratricopeptide repeat protein [Planctomycetota bacterium]